MGLFTVTTVATPKRDIDLFGPTTVRIDRRRSDEIAGVPVLYLSAYVADDPDFVQKVGAALAWITDGAFSAARAGDAPNKPSPEAAVAAAVPAVDETPAPSLYFMPDFVEDVDYGEPLFLPEDFQQADWKAWAAAMLRRIQLATTAGQLAELTTANAVGMKWCPWKPRAEIGRALTDAYLITADQAAAA